MKIERMVEPKVSVEMQRPRPKEGYPLPGIDAYVKALVNRLQIPEEELQRLQNTSKAGLGEWMSAIQLIKDDRLPVRALIGSGRILLTSDMKLPEKITEKTPLRQIVQTDALCLAKLGIIQELAPLNIARKSKKREREIRKQIGELTPAHIGGGRLERISFKEAFTSLDPKKIAPALAVAGFALASCTGGPKPIEPSPTEAIATEVAPTLEPTPTETTEPTQTPTPTPTIEPSPTPEPLPTTYLDPKLQEQVVEHFLEIMGNEFLEKALEEVFENNPNYNPGYSLTGLDEKTPMWIKGLDFLNLGGARISISQLPGGSPEDFVQIMFLGHPGMSGILTPAVMGIQRNGEWVQATNFFDEDYGEPPFEIATPEELDELIEKSIGELVRVSVTLRFREVGDWNGPHILRTPSSFKECDVLKELMDIEGSYIQKYTEDPSLLGKPLPPRPDGTLAGENADLREVVQELNPEVDPGLYVWRVKFKEHSSHK